MKKAYAAVIATFVVLALFLIKLDRPAPVKIGATYMNLNNPYFIDLNDTIRRQVEGHGDILIARDPALDQSRQNDIVYEFLEEGVDVVIIQPLDARKVQPAIDACYEKGVPVVVVDSQIYDNSKVLFEVVSDNYKAGRLIAEDMNEKYSGGNVLLIYQNNTQSSSDRAQGFLDHIREEFRIVKTIDNVEGLEATMEQVDICLEEGLEFELILHHTCVIKVCIALKDKVWRDYRLESTSICQKDSHSNSEGTKLPHSEPLWTLPYIPLHPAIHLHSL